MTVITIRDLPQSDELDRRAMLTIVGGTRTGARPIAQAGAAPRDLRVVDYPPGWGVNRPTGADANGPAPGGAKAR